MASVPSVPFVAHSKERRAGIPKQCTVCGVRLLNRHELTGLCLEDKLIAHNGRLSTPVESSRAESAS
jgi:hypothetical protein